MAKKFSTEHGKSNVVPIKKKKKGAAAEPPPKAAAPIKAVNGKALDLSGGSNPRAKEASILLHFEEILKRKKTASSSNSRVAAQKTLAKKDNVDTTLMNQVVALADREDGDVSNHLRELVRYIRTCLPQVQLNLFEEDGDREYTREAQIFDLGYRCGRDARKNQTDNPHGKGSIEHEIWADGYMYGQKKNASLIGPMAKVDSAGKVPGAEDSTAH